ncbi:MAG TPA: MoxR family ATPase [Bacilli bacterium]|mgnify:CR=1 FL=1|uniref:MoxR family ATPase n=1 Tax=Amphibacillus indicireducens TaxID=1076330 RepID=A0ABP7VPY5_9BACI|nr:MoxR family ATPase [Bacilli bacterium]
MQLTEIKPMMDQVKRQINKVIVGKEQVIDQLLVSLLASRHVLLEDVPGTGKTLLAKTLATAIDCDFNRIQFTPDLLPSDVIGVTIFHQHKGEFEFQKGPIFTNILLADEINRATPRTQSSLLEGMEEKQVTVDGKTYQLDEPFLVIATQNPIESQGTFPLPEAQLDRFFIKVNLGYPDKNEGIEILKRFRQEQPLTSLASVISRDDLIKAQQVFTDVEVDDAIFQYIIEIADVTRHHEDIVIGLSPRGTQALLRAAQALAVIRGRTFVTPDDVKMIAPAVIEHRLVYSPMIGRSEDGVTSIVDQILQRVEVPTENFKGNRG